MDKSIHGGLQHGLWIKFHGLTEFTLSLPPRVGLTHIRETIIFFQRDIFQDIFEDTFKDSQTPPSSSLKLVEFETY